MVARDALLVVYAILWGAATPTFARLRAFSFPSTRSDDSNVRRFAWRRLAVGSVLATAVPILLLAGIWTLMPATATGFWPMAGGALAGTSAAAFPRLLHGVLASNQTHRWFYTQREWEKAIEDWDSLVNSDDPGPANDWSGFVGWGLIQLLVPVAIGLWLATAGNYPYSLAGMTDRISDMLGPMVGAVPVTVTEAAVVLAGLTLAAVLYDVIWVRRPRLRMRIRKWHGSNDLDLMFINRGGASYTVIQVLLQVSLPDGTHPKGQWDSEPMEVPAFGARHVRLDPGAEATGEIWIEAIPMGNRFVPLPKPGWEGHSPGAIRRLLRKLGGWGEVPRGVSRELRGYRTPPDPDSKKARSLR